MRYEDLRRERGIGSLWLRLRLAGTRPVLRRSDRSAGDLTHLSEHQLKDIGLERRDLPGLHRASVPYWRICG